MTHLHISILRGVILAACLFIGLLGQAQSPDTVLDRITAHYNGQQHLQYRMKVNYHESLSSDKPDHTATLTVNQNRTATYINIIDGQQKLEQYLSETTVLEVDHHAQIVYYQALEEQPAAISQPAALQGILALAKTDGITLSSFTEEERTAIRIAAPQASGTTIDLFYDQDFRILQSRLIIDVPDGRYPGVMNGKKIVCSFEYLNQLPNKQLNDFIQQQGNELRLATGLQQYTLLR